jgi:hypothetical protein
LLHKSGELLQAAERAAGAADVRLVTERTAAKIVGNEENSMMIGMKLKFARKAFQRKVKISNWDIKRKYSPWQSQSNASHSRTDRGNPKRI